MLFPKDEDLDFHKVVMKKGETVEFDPYTITLNGLHKEVTHPDYKEEEGDIVVQAELIVRDRAGQTVDVLDLYLLFVRISPISSGITSPILVWQPIFVGLIREKKKWSSS